MPGTHPGAALRALVKAAAAARAPLPIAGACSAYTALMAERLGFPALYLSGGGVALSSLGMPDLAVSTLGDVTEDCRRIARVAKAPLLVDADTGFGGALSVARTVKDLEAAGAAGLHIEDQVAVKRCGHRPNKQVVSPGEMVARIRAAAGARSGSGEMLLMARTDAIAVEGLDAAVERCRLYAAEGADAIFAEAVTSLDDYQRFCEALPGVPVLANMTEFGKTDLWARAELGARGVSMALYPLSAFRAMSRAAEGVYSRILSEDGNAGCVADMHTREQTYEVIDYHKHEAAVDAAARAAQE